MADVESNPNETWRNYTKQVSIQSCRLHVEDLKRLYRLINDKQLEAGSDAVARLWKTENEAQEQFEARRRRVKDAFITTVRIKGTNAEVVTGHGEVFFDSGLLPETIASVEYDTAFSPKAQLNFTPNDRASAFLDFSRPTIFGSGLPSEPTPNNSNWFVTAQTEGWSTSLSARLEHFFAERKTPVEWLHRSNTYDGLLIVAEIDGHQPGDTHDRAGGAMASLLGPHFHAESWSASKQMLSSESTQSSGLASRRAFAGTGRFKPSGADAPGRVSLPPLNIADSVQPLPHFGQGFGQASFHPVT